MTTDRPPQLRQDGPLDPDGLTMDAIRAGVLRDRPVTVLGFARSGIALARFLVDAGARVTVYDGRPAAEYADHALVVPSDTTARIQEMHLLLVHLLSEAIDSWAAGESVSGEEDGSAP